MISQLIRPTAFRWLTVLEVSMWPAIRMAAISLARQVGRLMRRVRALAVIGRYFRDISLGRAELTIQPVPVSL